MCPPEDSRGFESPATPKYHHSTGVRRFGQSEKFSDNMIEAPARQSLVQGTDLTPPFRVKWVATDLDGTFLDAHHVASEKTRCLYKRLIQQGVHIIPCTGRTLSGAKTVVELSSKEFSRTEMRYCPGVYANGAVIYGNSEEELLHEAVIAPELLHSFWSAAYRFVDERNHKGQPTDLVIMAQNRHHGMVDFDSDHWKAYAAKWSEEPCQEAGMRLTSPEFSASEHNFILTNVVLDDVVAPIFLNWLESDEMYQSLNPRSVLKTLSPVSPLVSCFRADVNKANALRILMEHFPHLDPNSYVAIGDGTNDIEMLKAAPFAVAMGQAGHLVKSSAHVCAEDNAQEGWSLAMERFVEPTLMYGKS